MFFVLVNRFLISSMVMLFDPIAAAIAAPRDVVSTIDGSAVGMCEYENGREHFQQKGKKNVCEMASSQ